MEEASLSQEITMADHSPITDALQAWSEGDPKALEDLMALVYTELREMSRHALSGERHAHTLNPTALANEVYLRLASLKRVRWEDRKPFFSFASTLMRRIIVEHARAVKAQKRGGLLERVDLELLDLPDHRDPIDVLDLDNVLEQLQKQDPFLVRLIELRFFSGLNEIETAEVWGVSRTKVQREWRVGKLLLEKLLRGEHSD
jgi:RNA polymerase sigma factor (TIGR02999 family)